MDAGYVKTRDACGGVLTLEWRLLYKNSEDKY